MCFVNICVVNVTTFQYVIFNIELHILLELNPNSPQNNKIYFLCTNMLDTCFIFSREAKVNNLAKKSFLFNLKYQVSIYYLQAIKNF